MRAIGRESPDVRAAGDDGGGAVLVQVDRRRRLLADVEPEPDGDTASGTLGRIGLVVIARLERFEAFDEADPGWGMPIAARSPSTAASESHFERVHAELLRCRR